MSEFFEYEQNNEALRLIQHMDDEYPEDWDAAAIRDELRRLHEAHDWWYRMAGDRLRRIEKLEAERDALLVALQEIVEDQEEFRICCGESMWREHDDKCWVPKAKAAINAIRGDK